MVGRAGQRQALHLFRGRACAARRDVSARASTEAGRDRRGGVTRLPSLRRTLSLDRSPFSEIRRPRLAAGPSCVHRYAKAGDRGWRSLLPPDRAMPARWAGAGRQAVRNVGLSCADAFPAAPSLVALQSASWPLAWSRRGRENLQRCIRGSLHRARDRRHAVRRACRSVVSPSFGLTRPMRPRFGMSNRRPSSLRFASISRPQRPCSAFFPWSLRAHSSRFKKASPWPPSTAWRPCGCGPIASGQRQPSRSRWSRPEKRKRTRTWLPSATSP